ncbi:MAG: MOSC domain-containing protein [Polyangiales bacterium]|nr:MOSC domain-containing protein [Myxococcales bacterium]
MSPLRVAELCVYPVKSATGLSVREWPVDAFGLALDRRFMVVDANGRFVTQREEPRMCLVQAGWGGDGKLTLTAEGRGVLEVDSPEGGHASHDVTVWNDTVRAVDCGAAAGEWWSDYLGRPARLMFIAEPTARTADPEYAPARTPVSFADGFPFLITTTASLADLNGRLETPLPMRRFRPNIVIEGAEPFEEDTWHRIRIGDVEFDLVKPCARCSITTVDPETAQVGKEPLKTLATFRRTGNKVLFGQNAVHSGPGRLRVGEGVEVLASGSGGGDPRTGLRPT